MTERLTVAVLFGGASQEHDVSVVSAQQLMDAADVQRIEIVPVYIDFENRFYGGANLRDVTKYRPRPPGRHEVRFLWSDMGPAMERISDGTRTLIDCVLPVVHGPFGEDGRLQGYFERLGIPVTGFNANSSAVAMRKDVTKAIVKSVGVNVLDHVAVDAHQMRDPNAVTAQVSDQLGFPVVVKPANLGSSIGVGIAKTADELLPLIDYVLTQDSLALVEPKVENLREFNIAMTYRDGEIKLSAIECPKSDADLLDFKEKYLSASAPKGAFLPSEGMLSLTRDINPDLPEEVLERIYDYARKTFGILGLRGAPRIDFMQDAKTGEIWFNEINPIPGSYGFFLWEAAPEPFLYPELITHLVQETLGSALKSFDDPVPQNAYLLPR